MNCGFNGSPNNRCVSTHSTTLQSCGVPEKKDCPTTDNCTLTILPSTFPANYNGSISIAAAGDCFVPNQEYHVLAYSPAGLNDRGVAQGVFRNLPGSTTTTSNQKLLTASLDLTGESKTEARDQWATMPGAKYPGGWTYKVCRGNTEGHCGEPARVVGSGSFTVQADPNVSPANVNFVGKWSDKNSTCVFVTGTEVKLQFTEGKPNTDYKWWQDEGIFQPYQCDRITGQCDLTHMDASGNGTFTLTKDHTQDPKTKRICLDYREAPQRNGSNDNCINLQFVSRPPTGETSCASINKVGIQSTPIPPSPPCTDFDGQGGCKAVNTAIGKIEVSPVAFIRRVFAVILSLAGGIALMLIIYSGYKLMTSQGNAETIQGARETLTSAIVGLLFIIFSLVIFEVVTGDILKIPGF